MRYVFITGTSRGLGHAMLDIFREDRIISISRSKVETDVELYKEFHVDFLDEQKLEEMLPEIFNSISPEKGDEIYLINNAGIVGPVHSIANMDAQGFMKNYKINVLAPALLMKGYVNAFSDIQAAKRILTVSSGAALNPMEGWSAYCSSKAAVNMVSDVLRQEMDRLDYPIFTATYRPGVVDTDMQGEIRSADPEEFPDLETFKKHKSSNRLYPPKVAAYVAKRIITSDNFGFSESYSISDFL
ncbi:SDR family NAD(P)-dependent oxidoreductase [Salinicoccus siamensis]|uniref:SDR family NAD(P)-dependent oxidoreductase n=1 Tax=Salinicoccus siamensis TaxID=381830 RepID=A0ABV5Z1L2_9STAP